MSSETDRLSARVATTAIMLVAYVKARVILINFMRVCDAPVVWRILLELWLFAVVGEILIYALAR